MTLNALIPNVFYEDIRTGIAFFCDALGFRNAYEAPADETPFCIARRDAVCVHLVTNAEVARQDRPEIRIDTDDIDAYHAEIMSRAPHALHPNGKSVTLKPWGLREFALLDPTGVCVIVQQAA